MKTAEEYHAQYPIGSQWLLPVTVEAHLTPAHDDYDPRPIKLAYKPDAGPLYPRCRDLPELIPAAEQTAAPVPNIAPPCHRLHIHNAPLFEDESTALQKRVNELTDYLSLHLQLTAAQYSYICKLLNAIFSELETLDHELDDARDELRTAQQTIVEKRDKIEEMEDRITDATEQTESVFSLIDRPHQRHLLPDLLQLTEQRRREGATPQELDLLELTTTTLQKIITLLA